CHRIGDQGERIGPELTGIGGRFSKNHIVESILQPSPTLTPRFPTVTPRLLPRQILTRLQNSETETSPTPADPQGQKHELAKSEIEIQQPQAKSTMPDNVAQQLTPAEFLDLIAFLTQRETSPP